MFSALTQGSPVYLLDKTSSLDYKVGEIVGVTQPRFSTLGNTVDLKIKVGESVQEFSSVPSVNTFVSYNNGNVIISETKQGIQNEVESILQNRKYHIDNIDNYKNDIIECESILKQLNPQFAIDKERDERLSSLEGKFDSLESKIDKIFNLVQK